MKTQKYEIQNTNKIWFFILGLYAILICSTIIWCNVSSTDELRRQLITVSPWFLEINFFLIVIGILLNVKAFRMLLNSMTSSQSVLLISIVLIGICLSMFVAPRVHRILYDENIYLNIGQTIAAQKKAAMCSEGYNNYGAYHCVQLEHNKEPAGFPYLISIVYRLFGPSEIGGFLLNNLFFGLSIFVVFLIGYFFLNYYMAGLYAAIVYWVVYNRLCKFIRG